MFYKFMVYLDGGTDHDGNDILMKIAVPAKDERDARDYVFGNGEIVSVQDVSDEYPIKASRIYDALETAGFNRHEIDFIVRTLTRTEIAR